MDFSKINDYKVQTFKIHKELKYMLLSYMPATTTQFLKQYVYFGSAKAEKGTTEDGMFLIILFLLIWLSYVKIIDMFLILSQNWTTQMFFKRNFEFWNLAWNGLIWPDIGISLCLIWKWMSPSNSMFQMTHTTCSARHLCIIFIGLFGMTLTFT